MQPHRQLLPVGGKRVNIPTALACERNALLLLKRHITFVSALTPVVYHSLLAESSPRSLMTELIPSPPRLLCRLEAAVLYYIEQYLLFISRTAWTLRPFRPHNFFQVMWILQDSVLKTLYRQASDVEELDQPEDLQGDVEGYGESWKGVTQGAVPIVSSGKSNCRCSLFCKREGLRTLTQICTE